MKPKRHVLSKEQKPGGFVKGFYEHCDSDDGIDAGWVLRACLIDTQARDCVYDPEGGRWVVTCELHGAAHNFNTRVQAEWFAVRPGSFCPDCAEREADWLVENEPAYR